VERAPTASALTRAIDCSAVSTACARAPSTAPSTTRCAGLRTPMPHTRSTPSAECPRGDRFAARRSAHTGFCFRVGCVRLAGRPSDDRNGRPGGVRPVGWHALLASVGERGRYCPPRPVHASSDPVVRVATICAPFRRQRGTLARYRAGWRGQQRRRRRARPGRACVWRDVWTVRRTAAFVERSRTLPDTSRTRMGDCSAGSSGGRSRCIG
jgi:hypothetical protein